MKPGIHALMLAVALSVACAGGSGVPTLGSDMGGLVMEAPDGHGRPDLPSAADHAAAPGVDHASPGLDAEPSDPDAGEPLAGDGGAQAMCLAATSPCQGDSDCCTGLSCDTTSLGQVCCGNTGAPCATVDGSDCCGALLCEGGTCGGTTACQPATTPCQTAAECCDGLACGNTSLGQVCCGNEGASCATANGEDCCGDLLCTGGHCTGGGGGGTVKFRAPIADEFLSGTYISAYFDHGGQDWNCQGNRYDGHQGSDFACKNGQACIDEGRTVVAGAPGEVIAKADGAFDRCTDATCSPPNGNFVRLRHADGSTTWYLHMKKFSIVVNMGDQVSCGQKLGEQASSGESTGAHTHFHFNASQQGAPGDPFGGSCSQPGSRWVNQQNHGSGQTSAGPDQLPGADLPMTSAAVEGRRSSDGQPHLGL